LNEVVERQGNRIAADISVIESSPEAMNKIEKEDITMDKNMSNIETYEKNNVYIVPDRLHFRHCLWRKTRQQNVSCDESGNEVPIRSNSLRRRQGAPYTASRRHTHSIRGN
ncbi:MAG: hypothetical protein K2O47_05510, partial [Muribaculaceae bacterium]|nr:hypothetical protein [Muribaculaceae bacterium]